MNLAFLGALVGSVARPLGGKLADRIGGARVTLWNFVCMGLATFGVIHFVHEHSFGGFLAMFLRPVRHHRHRQRLDLPHDPGDLPPRAPARRAAGKGRRRNAGALEVARRESAAVLGFTSAIGACGGYLIPRSFGASIKATGGAERGARLASSSSTSPAWR